MLHYRQAKKNNTYSKFITSLSTEYYTAMIDYLYDCSVWSDFDSESKLVFGFGYI